MENLNDLNLGKDISNEFILSCKNREYKYGEFVSFLRGLRQESLLKIDLDLTNEDRENFVVIARMLKAFLENKKNGQEIKASIKCTKKQKAWEYNVFASGVDWVESI